MKNRVQKNVRTETADTVSGRLEYNGSFGQIAAL